MLRALSEILCDLSRISHRLATGQNRSWCARAWENRNTCVFWRLWVRIFGKRHCETSWRRYSDRS